MLKLFFFYCKHRSLKCLSSRAVYGWFYFVSLTFSSNCFALIASGLENFVVPSAHREQFLGDLSLMKQRKLIRALVITSRTDFFIYEGKPKGIQADFLREYEKFLNRGIRREADKTRIVFIPVTFDRLIPDLIEGKGDIAAAMLTPTAEREQEVSFASYNMRANQVVVMHRDVKGVDSIDDLSGKALYVPRSSSYIDHLRDLNSDFVARHRAPVAIHEADPYLLSADILELINSKVIDMTVVDDYKARLWAKVLPNIVVRDDLKIYEGNRIGWAVRKNNPALHKSLNAFMWEVRRGSLLGNILFKRYFESVRWVNKPMDLDNRAKLRQYLTLFKKYGDRYSINFLALAAQAYQESGFDQSAVSDRGAIGIMQLLPSTAADPNVSIRNIRRLENNIHAGAKYLAYLRDRYYSSPKIAPSDRMALSWAAYNAGPLKVRQTRSLASKMGYDPNRWFHNVEIAANRNIGRETVRYVANIYKYYIAYTLTMELINKKHQAIDYPLRLAEDEDPLFSDEASEENSESRDGSQLTPTDENFADAGLRLRSQALSIILSVIAVWTMCGLIDTRLDLAALRGHWRNKEA